MTDRLTIRLGTLAVPLAAFARRQGLDQSRAVKRLLSQALGVPEPPAYRGNESFGEQGRNGAAARWSKHRKS